MAKVPLVALERFYYAGRNVEKDEQFDAEEMDVALLTHSVSPRAKLPPEVEPQVGLRATSKEVDEPAPKPASYKRRDLEAEDS
jgi:hypothetical protein